MKCGTIPQLASFGSRVRDIPERAETASAEGFFSQWAVPGLNRGPSDFQSLALPAELTAQCRRFYRWVARGRQSRPNGYSVERVEIACHADHHSHHEAQPDAITIAEIVPGWPRNTSSSGPHAIFGFFGTSSRREQVAFPLPSASRLLSACSRAAPPRLRERRRLSAPHRPRPSQARAVPRVSRCVAARGRSGLAGSRDQASVQRRLQSPRPSSVFGGVSSSSYFTS